MFSDGEKAIFLFGSCVVFWLVKKLCKIRKKYDFNSYRYIFSVLLPTALVLFSLAYIADNILRESKIFLFFTGLCVAAGASFVIFSADYFD